MKRAAETMAVVQYLLNTTRTVVYRGQLYLHGSRDGLTYELIITFVFGVLLASGSAVENSRRCVLVPLTRINVLALASPMDPPVR
jgi:hypothetical protein